MSSYKMIWCRQQHFTNTFRMFALIIQSHQYIYFRFIWNTWSFVNFDEQQTQAFSHGFDPNEMKRRCCIWKTAQEWNLLTNLVNGNGMWTKPLGNSAIYIGENQIVYKNRFKFFSALKLSRFGSGNYFCSSNIARFVIAVVLWKYPSTTSF